jgi:hypothetical protein
MDQAATEIVKHCAEIDPREAEVEAYHTGGCEDFIAKVKSRKESSGTLPPLVERAAPRLPEVKYNLNLDKQLVTVKSREAGQPNNSPIRCSRHHWKEA